MTEAQCRAIESIYFQGRPVTWPAEQIAAAISRWKGVVARLLAGDAIDISESMGSCQCGDITAMVLLVDGIVVARSSGSMAWQRYDGPASECYVSYGVGVRARQIAAAYAAHG